MKSPAEVVMDLMSETPEQTTKRRAEQAERRENEALIAKLENNDIYRDKERDDDLKEITNKKSEFSPRNRTERESDFC